MDSHAITNLDQLRGVHPAPRQRSLDKEIDHLDEHCRRFIACSPFVLVASADAEGRCDVSPKGGPPGFVHVLDERRLLIPDATGNRRLDGMRNMLENPQVGLLFLIPGMGETLRVNGPVELTTDPALLEGLQTGGKPAKLALIVHAREVFLHCAKCIIRSGLWRTETWGDPEQLPSAAAILNDHIGIGDLAQSAASLADSYENRL